LELIFPHLEGVIVDLAQDARPWLGSEVSRMPVFVGSSPGSGHSAGNFRY
jgi:hypothetical protein